MNESAPNPQVETVIENVDPANELREELTDTQRKLKAIAVEIREQIAAELKANEERVAELVNQAADRTVKAIKGDRRSFVLSAAKSLLAGLKQVIRDIEGRE